MAAMNYVVTVQRPTAVTGLTTGHFTSANDFNLIIAKNTHFEIYIINSEGLKLVKDVCVYGKISAIKCFRLSNMNKDVLFIFTDKCHGMILDCRKTSNDQYEILTKCHGLLKDTGRQAVRQPLCTIDAKHGVILLRIFEGVIKLIYIKELSSKESSSKNLEAYNVKIDEQNIVDLQFLPGHQKPTFAVLHLRTTDTSIVNTDAEEHHLRTYQVELKEKDIAKLSWKQDMTLSEASFIIPIGHDTFSCLVIGRNTVALYKENDRPLEIESSLLDDEASIIGYCPIDENGCRYLLTDYSGKLYLLVLERDKRNGSSSTTITDMKLDLLGETSMCEFITYLDNGVTFIGSRFGDSQLIRLLPEPENGSHLEMLESYTNLGPIVDMCVVDLERQGRQLITCSGNGKDSSLRFIRTGIGIHEHASIDLRNIKGIWALKVDHHYDNHLVVAFFDQTRLFHLQNDEIEEVELAGFDFQHQTLFCANVISDQYLQITTHSIRLIGNSGKDLLIEWTNEQHEITVGSSNTTQCVCASGNQLFYFEIGRASLSEINKCKLPYNIACLDVTPLNPQEERSSLCVVGLWTQISVWMYRLPTLEVLHKEPLTSDTLPRSVVMIAFDAQPYVVISLADGPIVYYLLDTVQGLLYERKKVALGTKPTTLTICQRTDISPTTTTSSSSDPSTQRTVLFACSDRPSVISSSNSKLVFSAVNLREIVCMCSFNSDYYGASLTLVTDMGVILGRIDDIQKLHVRSLRLGEPARRIAFMEDEKAYIILTQYLDMYQSNSITPISKHAQQKIDCTTTIKNINDVISATQNDVIDSIVILDQHTHEARISVRLLSREEPLSVCTITFADDLSTPYIAIGTAIIFEDEDTPKIGRIILYRYKNGHLNMLTEKELSAAPHAMLAFQGKLLVAVGSSIRLYKLSSQNHELVQLTQYLGHIDCLQLKIKDDFVLFNDLMKSITVLRYNVDEGKFEEIAHDVHPQWSTACEFFDDDTFICAEDGGNLISCHKDSGSTKENERNVLKELGLCHLGENINVFRHGCLVTQQTAESSISLETCTLMGSVSGYIGLLLQLTAPLYQLLMSLQLALAEHVPSVGKIDHGAWRGFESDGRSDVSCGFVDGDLIETYLDLPKLVQQELIKDLQGENNIPINTTVEELVKIIEELARIH
ncbi:unnamed protein product [Rotaria magnacalcarata]|uniref:DNA damage-binding protein 1 n=5 Tax=Rotaria magnacalcarata TaxID=392030 RepID=A0A815H011_9BILA|nr:unnamed protein product [Rotaria magnacalcarata]CAF1510376.1 unnamed protein product [Rotaria magnacalcarata]CAF2122024.1 unnamed protein product [Rotaria magnacalcarata]CAF2142839.1 unnamed protein product [Rotaria magnacalcarata]CAF3871530.1 unnamed protein product [Rotaria magnacalcarata]